MTERIRVRLWYATTTDVSPPVVEGSSYLDLTDEETSLLDRVLVGYLSDLRMEIVDTDNPAMRRDLKHEQQLLQSLHERLQPLLTDLSRSAPD